MRKETDRPQKRKGGTLKELNERLEAPTGTFEACQRAFAAGMPAYDKPVTAAELYAEVMREL